MTLHPDGIARADIRDDASGDRLVDWLRHDPQLAEACSTAVDPLEIAARLETHGVGNKMAVERFGYTDLFALADEIYASVAYEEVGPQARDALSMGGPLDLLRGGIFALPALFLPIAISGFAVHPRWWALPVGLTVAWALGQAFAVLVGALRGQDDMRSDSIMSIGSTLITSTACLGCAVLACWSLGGNEASVIEAVAVGVYLAAGGLLLSYRSEWLLAVCMVPATLGSLSAVGLLPITITHGTAAWMVIATLVLVVVAAHRQLLMHRWRWPTWNQTDRRASLKFLAFGLGCGLITSMYIGFAYEADGNRGTMAIVAFPLLLTLGVMEWQLHSFRCRAASAMSTSRNLFVFARRIRSSYLLSLGTYSAALSALSITGLVVGYIRNASMTPLLLFTLAVGTIGVTFFVMLLLTSVGHINLVLVYWVGTLVVLGATLVTIQEVAGGISATAGITALLVTTGTAATALAAQARWVLTDSMNY